MTLEQLITWALDNGVQVSFSSSPSSISPPKLYHVVIDSKIRGKQSFTMLNTKTLFQALDHELRTHYVVQTVTTGI